MTTHRKLFEKWFENKKRTVCLSIIDYKKPWIENGNPPMYCIKTNGSIKNRCFDFMIYFRYLIFTYTRWSR